jgi:chromosome segregation ATPase
MSTYTQIKGLERELAKAQKEIVAWNNKWQVAVEMAAVAESELADALTALAMLGDRHERELADKRSQINRLINVVKSRDTDKVYTDKRCNELRDELVATREQRDELAEALKSLCRVIISEEPRDITDLLKQSGAAIAAVEGGSNE